MTNVIDLSSMVFNSWDHIEVNQKQIAVSPSWRNGWSRTFFYIKDNNLCFENVSLILRCLDYFGWYRHLDKNALWEGLKLKKIIPEGAQIPEKSRFRSIVYLSMQVRIQSALIKRDLNNRLSSILQRNHPIRLPPLYKSLSPPPTRLPPLVLPDLSKMEFIPLDFEDDSSSSDSGSSDATSGSDSDSSSEDSKSSTTCSTCSNSSSDSDIDVEQLMDQSPVLLEASKMLEGQDLSGYDRETQRTIKWFRKKQKKHPTVPNPLPDFSKIKDENKRDLYKALLTSASLKDFSMAVDRVDLSFLDGSRTTIKAMPAEVLFHIFSFLGGFHLKCLSLVCWKYNTIVKAHTVFAECFQNRGCFISKIESPKHLRILGSFINREFGTSEVQVGSGKPLIFAQLKKGVLIKVDDEGVWRGDLKIEQLFTISDGTANFQMGVKTGIKANWGLRLDHTYFSNIPRPHHRYENGQCFPFICDWNDNKIVMTINDRQQGAIIHIQDNQCIPSGFECQAVISSLCMTDDFMFIGFETGRLEVRGFPLNNPALPISWGFLDCRLNENSRDEVIHIQTFLAEKRLLAVTKEGVCTIWQISSSGFQPEKRFKHSEGPGTAINFAKILGDTYLLTADINGICKLTDIQAEKFFLLRHNAAIRACTFFCNTLFIAYADNKVVLWDMNNGAKLKEYQLGFSVLDLFFNEECLSIIGNHSEAIILNLHFDVLRLSLKVVIDRNFDSSSQVQRQIGTLSTLL